MPKVALGLRLVLALFAAVLAGACASPPEEEMGSTANALEGAQSQYDDLGKAMATVTLLDTRLSREVMDLGPALTPDDANRYVLEYRARSEYQAARATYRDTTLRLSKVLATILPELETYARTHQRPRPLPVPGPGAPPPDTSPIYELPPGAGDLRGSLLEYYALLAKTPAAGEALAFASHCLERDTLAAKALTDRFNGGYTAAVLVDRIVVPALTRTVAASLARRGGGATSQDAIADLRAAAAVPQGIVARVIDIVDAFQRGGTHDLGRLTGTLTATRPEVTSAFQLGNTKLGHAVKGVGIILTLWEVGQLSSAVAHGAADSIAQLVRAGADGLASVLEGTIAVRELMLGAEVTTPAALTAAKSFAAKIGAGLGVLLTINDAMNDLGKWDASASAKVRVLGDLIGIASGVLALTGSTGPLAPALALVSMGVLFLADALAAGDAYRAEQAEQAAMSGEKRQVLGRIFAGPGDPLPETLAYADSGMLAALGTKLELTPANVLSLARRSPSSVRVMNFERPKGYGLTRSVKCTFRMNGDQFFGMLVAIAGSDVAARANELVGRFLSYFEHDASSVWAFRTFDEYLTRFRGIASTGYPDERVAFGRALSYIEARQSTLRAQPASRGCVGW